MKNAVATAQPEFHLKGLTGCDRVGPSPHHFEEVVGVMRGLPAPPGGFFRGLPGVLVPARIVPIDPTAGVGGPHDDRNRLGQDAEALFGIREFNVAHAQRRFRSFARVNLQHVPEPARNAAAGIVHRIGGKEHPAVQPIGTTQARFNPRGVARSHRRQPGSTRALAIIRVNAGAPGVIERDVTGKTG